MEIGFINFNTAEKKRIAKLMQQLMESEAIEELGIGRVRDHFSNTLFPGTSTLQHHAKYFVVLPSLFYHAAYGSRRFHSTAEVDRYIKEAEIEITRQMASKPDGSTRTDITGITGINTYREAMTDYRKYVKYDPAYIYGSGLVRFGIVPDGNINRLILELNHRHSAAAGDKTADNPDTLSGETQLIRTCGETYVFTRGTDTIMEMALTANEASFLKACIHQRCEGSLLDFLLECPHDIDKKQHYFNLGEILAGLNHATSDCYHMSVLFSKLVHLIDWRYNRTYYNSFGNAYEAGRCDAKYSELCGLYEPALVNEKAYGSLFDYIRLIDPMLTDFCESCYSAIRADDTPRIDSLVRSREYVVKRERSKIGNIAYKNDRRIDPAPNTFRWETVRTMVNEIRHPL